MAGIRRRDTKPELLVRTGLHRLGFRFRLDVAALPGRPDVVLPKYRAVVFVNGCFWHGHDCHLFKVPSTGTGRWMEKIDGNRARDQRNVTALLDSGWRVLTIWECATKGRKALAPADLLERCAGWIAGTSTQGEIRGAS